MKLCCGSVSCLQGEHDEAVLVVRERLEDVVRCLRKNVTQTKVNTERAMTRKSQGLKVSTMKLCCWKCEQLENPERLHRRAR